MRSVSLQSIAGHRARRGPPQVGASAAALVADQATVATDQNNLALAKAALALNPSDPDGSLTNAVLIAQNGLNAANAQLAADQGTARSPYLVPGLIGLGLVGLWAAFKYKVL
jgi:hypothetical protein